MPARVKVSVLLVRKIHWTAGTVGNKPVFVALIAAGRSGLSVSAVHALKVKLKSARVAIAAANPGSVVPIASGLVGVSVRTVPDVTKGSRSRRVVATAERKHLYATISANGDHSASVRMKAAVPQVK